MTKFRKEIDLNRLHSSYGFKLKASSKYSISYIDIKNIYVRSPIWSSRPEIGNNYVNWHKQILVTHKLSLPFSLIGING